MIEPNPVLTHYKLQAAEATIAELTAALTLIAKSDGFNGGTFVKELQQIARNALAKAKAQA